MAVQKTTKVALQPASSKDTEAPLRSGAAASAAGVPLASLTGMALARAVGLLAEASPRTPASNPLDVQRAAAAALGTVPTHLWTGEQRHSLAGYLGVYLWRAYPPGPWRLAAVEPSYPGGAADLLWAHPDGRRLLDEIKIDSVPARAGGARRKVITQIQRHTAYGAASFGQDYVGLRLLTLSTPRRSMFIPPDGPWIALLTTPWCTEGGW